MTETDLEEAKHEGGFQGILLGLVLAAILIPLMNGFSSLSILFSMLAFTLALVLYQSEAAYEAFPEVRAALFPASVENEIGGEDVIKNEELLQQVKDREAEGWEVEEIDNESGRVVMKSTSGGTIGGHALTGLTTGLWTLGAGNIAYNKLSKKKNAERIVLRPTDDLPTDAVEPKQIENISDKLRELKTLYDDDIISEEDFEDKKVDLLDKY
ncbi:SHOCT domain-containing protein [Natrialbaceae archaeon A-CW1-1]